MVDVSSQEAVEVGQWLIRVALKHMRLDFLREVLLPVINEVCVRNKVTLLLDLPMLKDCSQRV